MKNVLRAPMFVPKSVFAPAGLSLYWSKTVLIPIFWFGSLFRLCLFLLFSRLFVPSESFFKPLLRAELYDCTKMSVIQRLFRIVETTRRRPRSIDPLLLIDILIVQFPPEARNIGSYFIIDAMSETQIQSFKEATLHLGPELITRLPRVTSFVFSLYWHPEPFFMKHRALEAKVTKWVTNPP